MSLRKIISKDVFSRWRRPFFFLLFLTCFQTAFPAEKPLPVKRWKTFLHKQENEKAIAAGITVALGTFGAHRLYLGTEPKVPVIYTLTLGGFMIIPLVDLGHILFVKDLTPYKNNPQVIMWNGKK